MDTALARASTPAAAKTSRAARVRRAKRIRRIVLGALAALLVVAIALAFRPRPIEVELATATRGDLVVTVDEMGKTRVRDRYVVSAPIGGNLVRVELHAGDPVARGQVLARIVPMSPGLLDERSRIEARARASGAEASQRQAQAQIARAQVAAAHADDELARTRRLVESGALSNDALLRAELEARLRSEELASSRFAEQMAASDAAMARAALRQFAPNAPQSATFDVASPVDGRVLRVVTQSAGPVQAGTQLVEVGDPTALEVVSDILSEDAARMHPGAAVKVDRWGGPPLAAHVRTVEPSAFTRLSALGVEEQRVPVVIDLDDPPDRWASLGDGYRVEVSVTVSERHGILRVPVASIFRHDEAWAVYAARSGRARLAPVKIGARSDVAVEIESGLDPGDAVIVHPGERIREGVRIEGQ